MAIYYIQPAKGIIYLQGFLPIQRSMFLCTKVLFYTSVLYPVRRQSECPQHAEIEVHVLKYKMSFIHVSMGTSRGPTELMPKNGLGGSLLLTRRRARRIQSLFPGKCEPSLWPAPDRANSSPLTSAFPPTRRRRTLFITQTESARQEEEEEVKPTVT